MTTTELERAIQTLTAFYLKGKKIVWVREPLAWALYHTWREIDEHRRVLEHQVKQPEAVTEDDVEQIVAYIKNFERKDIPDNVWEIIMKWWDMLYEC